MHSTGHLLELNNNHIKGYRNPNDNESDEGILWKNSIQSSKTADSVLLRGYDKYTQYIKKRNTYIFADNLSNFKDVHFKLAGYKD